MLPAPLHPCRYRDTGIYRLYRRLRHPDRHKTKLKEASFYHDLIRKEGGGLVFDVGANKGDKTIIFAQVAKRVVCVEPSPTASRILKKRFPNSKVISIVAAGVGAQVDSLAFHMFGESDCYNTFSTKWVDSLGDEDVETSRPAKKLLNVIDVPITTLDDLIVRFGTPCYIKIDVEGFEVEVIKGLSQAVNLISFECNLPEFESEALECLERIDEIQSCAQFNYCTTEPPTGFASNRWLNYSEMAQVIMDRCHPFMEIYSRRAPDR